MTAIDKTERATKSQSTHSALDKVTLRSLVVSQP